MLAMQRVGCACSAHSGDAPLLSSALVAESSCRPSPVACDSAWPSGDMPGADRCRGHGGRQQAAGGETHAACACRVYVSM